MTFKHAYFQPLLCAVALVAGCAEWIAPVSVGAPCSVGSDCGDGVCYKGHCITKPQCNGDGIIQSGEACDDGNSVNEDSCTNECLPARCGDGIIRKDLSSAHPDYEDCEPSLENFGFTCREDCVIVQPPRRVGVSLSNTCVLGSQDPDGDGPQPKKTYSYCLLTEQIGFGNNGEPIYRTLDFRYELEFWAEGIESISKNEGSSSDEFLFRGRRGLLYEGRVADIVQTGNISGRFSEGQWQGMTLFEYGSGTRQAKRSTERRCVLRRSGVLECKGYSDSTQCFDEGGSEQSTWVFGQLDVFAFASLRTSICAVTKQGEVWCEGDTVSWSDERCDGDVQQQQVANIPPIVQIVSGYRRYLALDRQGAVHQWGAMEEAPQNSDGTIASNVVPLNEPAVALAASYSMNCALGESQKVWCWSASDDSEPSQLDSLPPIQELAYGGALSQHLCAMDDATNVWCWGDGSNERLADLESGVNPDWPISIRVVP